MEDDQYEVYTSKPWFIYRAAKQVYNGGGTRGMTFTNNLKVILTKDSRSHWRSTKYSLTIERAAADCTGRFSPVLYWRIANPRKYNFNVIGGVVFALWPLSIHLSVLIQPALSSFMCCLMSKFNAHTAVNGFYRYAFIQGALAVIGNSCGFG